LLQQERDTTTIVQRQLEGVEKGHKGSRKIAKIYICISEKMSVSLKGA